MSNHLPEADQLAKIRKTHPRAYEPWGPAEDASFRRVWELFVMGELGAVKTYQQFVAWAIQRYGRQEGGIESRIRKVKGPGVDPRAPRVPRKPKPASTIRHPEQEPIPQINFSPEAVECLRLLNETNSHLFITGRAGTGKSTLLSHFRHTTEKQVVVLAPTGVAALNVEGQTIHSFCGFPADITVGRVKKLKPWLPKRKLLRHLETIIIDEISMVRADLLDCLDKFLRMNGNVPNVPFGGYQMVFMGDLYQLPPVESVMDADEAGSLFGSQYATPYFFDAHVFKNIECAMVELQTVYRQKDHIFIDILNAVRDNCATAEHLSQLNSRVDEGFQFEEGDFVVSLTTTNARASQINQAYLSLLPGEMKKYRGRIVGEFSSRLLPADEITTLREGAQVMLLNNDSEGRWVNGSMGKILRFEKREGVADKVVVELEDGTVQYVEPHSWEFFKYALDPETGTIGTKVLGSFKQYPMKLAWAVTIHKSQGKTFGKVHIDLGSGTFAHGQLYVALSRCRSLEGITLQRPIIPEDIKLDPRIVEFMDKLRA